MDVRCERCKTEYDFDDARITEAGVTVKCTTCGHVFKVKKKAVVVTVAVNPGYGPSAPASLTSSVPDRPREWKVRQSNGNVFTFRELTTLQKWIVERKVTRGDEISLTGETWKTLGQIAELSSFFQLVDEADRARQMEGMGPDRTLSQLELAIAAPLPAAPAPKSVASALPPPPPRPYDADTDRDDGTEPMDLPEPVLPPPPKLTSAPGRVETAAPVPVRTREPALGVFPALSSEPAFTRDPGPRTSTQGGRAPQASRHPSRTVPVVATVVVLALAASAWAYWRGVLPIPVLDAWVRRPSLRLDAGSAQQVPDAGLGALLETASVDAGMQASTASDAGSNAQDPVKVAAASVVAAGVADAGAARVKEEPVRDFDWYMSQGDRLREREKPQQALDAYSRATKMSPQRAEPVAGRGLAQLDLGNRKAAVEAFERALELNPRYGVALMGLAEAYKALGQNEDAVKYYGKYLDNFPEGSEASVARRALEKLKEPAPSPE